MNIKTLLLPAVTFACAMSMNIANAGLMTFDGAANTWNSIYDTSEVDVTFQSATFAWGGGYNDLTNVAYTNINQALVIDFSSLAGSTVTLNSFDLGNWLNNGSSTQYSVYDLGNLITPLLSAAPINVAYSTTAHPTFNVNQSSSNGIRLVVGPDLYNIGLDNVNFSSTSASVPEPSILFLFGLGLAGLGFTRRQKKS